ncbi:MAG TPA: glucose-1-phosphate thymidylyltransferase [Flavobacteriales bacterium]|nr:glucose-1-phosphate thymidylyltransferase [Flavobacteriales bacterium]HIO66730.1 glucose-1-phosphate thymidylyltransferase [Flavobacteriales bacterium]
MNVVLFDDQQRANLLPLAYTRPVADIRVGIITIREKWEALLGKSTSSSTESYLSAKFPLEVASENLFINGSVFPTANLVQSIQNLEPGKALVHGDVLVAGVLDADSANSFDPAKDDWSDTETYSGNLSKLSALWDIFSMNGEQIQADFDMITAGKTSQKASSTNNIIGNNLFIENGAIVEYATINTERGAVYIGKDAEIMEGSLIRGPFALCEGAQVKMGTKVYGPTTVGPGSRIGGEVTNCVIQAYSNKGHDGFLGNSVIGEWCNLGADTNNSNLKNNYGEVKMWNYAQRDYQPTGLQFCGLVMGDHSKAGINTMFNTGTVVGVNANVFGSGFPNKFIPSFSWGGAQGFSTFDVEKAKEVAVKMYERRGLEFDKNDQDILNNIFEMTKEFRT